MDKKIVIISLLTLVAHESIYANNNFGSGVVVGGFLGSTVALAATSGARASRDPYYDLERAHAQQELREIRAENRLRQEEERERRRAKREEEREEREYQRQLKQKERKEAQKQSKLKTEKSKQKNSKSATDQKVHEQQPNHHGKKSTQSPDELQLEIKKLELEIAQLKMDHKDKHHHAAVAA